MLNRDDALNLLEIVLQHSQADQTEVLFLAGSSALTRLANGGIHQHVAAENTEVRVRAVSGKRIGVATSNALDVDSLHTLVDRATQIARVSEPDHDFVSLPSPKTGIPTPIVAMPATFNPEARAEVAATLVNTAQGNGVIAAGHVATGQAAIAVGNSLGIRNYHAWPQCSVMAIMTKNGASGYAYWTGADLAAAPVDTLAGQASAKCLASSTVTDIAPGAYTVILEPPAVAEMLSMLAIMGLGATSLQEERCFMCGNVGKQLVGENITLTDDTYHPGMVTLPFDYEGVPRQAVTFFDRGAARGVVYDSYTAQKEGRESTGHALPAPNTYGPIPLNLVLHQGDQSRKQLIEGIDLGILVTRFHYVNIVHPKETILTGMTRDGTFLIEQGTVTRAVNNLRFTQSVLEALRQVTGIEHARTLINQEGMYCQVPTLRVDGFSFTS